MTSILVTGITVYDVVFKMPALPASEGKYYATERVEVVGGIAANASIAIARLGGEAHIATCLGRDAAGHAIEKSLLGDGVKLDRVQWAEDAASSQSCILVDPAGERLLINHADPGLFDREPTTIGQPGDRFDAVMCDTRWMPGTLATLDYAERQDIPSVVDFDRMPEKCGLEVIRRASHVVFGAAGLRALSKCQDLAQGLIWATKQSRAFLAVTDGARGVLWLDRGELSHMPAFQVTAVDTLGAGDVFHGAFAHALAHQMPIVDGLRYASAAAALKCMTFGGGRGTPARSEVERFLRERMS